MDFQTPTIFIVDPRTRAIDSIGRRGAGPGEFRQPWALGTSADTLWVLDGRARRVTAFDASGRYLTSRIYQASITPPLVMRSGGAFIAGTDGADGVLARRVGADRESGTSFGRALVPHNPVLPLRAIEAVVRQRRIPEHGRNVVLPVALPSGDVWLFLETTFSMQCFAADGTLKWTKSLDVPRASRILDQFFQDNQNAVARRTFKQLRYFADATAVGSEVWVLINSADEDPATLLLLSSNGDHTATIEVPGARGARAFAVDAGAQNLYFSIPEAASIMRVAIPANLGRRPP